MKTILSLVALCVVPAVASAQSPEQNPVLGENTLKVSDHVWAIMGWPNIGIVVGENATLVVDTGLGPRTVPRQREWRKNLRRPTSFI